MTSFRDKLSRLGSAGPGSRNAVEEPRGEFRNDAQVSVSAEDSKDDRIAKIRAALGAMTAHRAQTHAATPGMRAVLRERLQVGAPFESERGTIQIKSRRYDANHCHGRSPVANALSMKPDALATLALDPSLCELDLSRALFFDTETTGLAGGTGTIPFLIGMGWFEDGQLVVEQLVLPELGGEAPLLSRFAERVLKSSVLVSFNGKSFDWPLLRSRFVMSRMALPTVPPHVDLLHCARRVFRHRLEAMRLTQIEYELFGLEREGDVSGAEVPQIYFDWLRGADAERMHAVLEHNAWDIVALAALLGELSTRFESICEADPRDQLALARVALRAKDGARAIEFARAASESGHASVMAEAHALLGELHRRAGDHDKSARALCEAIEQGAGAPEALHLVLSKLYEHALGDYEQALAHARAAEDAEGFDASRKRVARLERKAAAKARQRGLLIE